MPKRVSSGDVGGGAPQPRVAGATAASRGWYASAARCAAVLAFLGLAGAACSDVDSVHAFRPDDGAGGGLPPVDIIPGDPAAPGVANPPDPPVALPPAGLGDPLPGIAEDENVALGGDPRTNLLAQRVLEILEAHCGDCHANGEAGGGFGDVLDLAKLIERGDIVPGSSTSSPLLALLQDGGQHPTSRAVVGSRPVRGDLALLARFIDELDSVSAPACQALAFTSQDAVYSAMLVDISAQPAPDRPFLRYFELAYASNAGLCGPALARQRHALFKMINSVSTASDISIPQAIDSGELIYRIDLRDYGWDRGIDLEDDGAVDFADAWLALVDGVGPYARELDGPEAGALKELTTTAVPLLPVNAFVHFSTVGDLYYALSGARASLDETRLELGVDIQAALQDNRVRRAGFYVGDPLSHESIALRLQQAVPERYYWFLEDAFTTGGSSIYSEPLDVGWGGRQIIYSLPNGLQAYGVEAESGARLSEVAVGCVGGDCERPTGINAAACHACHGKGLVPVQDEVRDYLVANQVAFDTETFGAALLQYPTAAELDTLMQHDSEIHVSAVERAGVPRDAPDPVSRVFLQFDVEELTLVRAAAELGVAREKLWQNLSRLDPRFEVIGSVGGSIDRNTFTDALGGALCVLYAGAKNVPLGCR